MNYQLQIVEDLSINGRLFLQGNAAVTGNVGISGTSTLGGSFVSSGSNLQMVNSTLSSTIANDFALFQGTAGDTVINSKSGQSLQLKINNTEYMRVHSNGYVGIGMTPSYTLDVQGELRIHTYLRSQNYLHILSNGNEIFYDSNTQYFRHSNGTERMRIASDGKVGIGTNNPQATLDVNGNLQVNGSMRFGSSPVIIRKPDATQTIPGGGNAVVLWQTSTFAGSNTGITYSAGVFTNSNSYTVTVQVNVCLYWSKSGGSTANFQIVSPLYGNVSYPEYTNSQANGSATGSACFPVPSAGTFYVNGYSSSAAIPVGASCISIMVF